MRIYSEKVVLPSEDGSLKIEPAILELSNGRILAVNRGKLTEGKDEEDLLNLGALLVAPAFVNAHTHIALASLRGFVGGNSYRNNVVEELYFRFESTLAAEDVRAFARIAALECLLSGTAVVWDHYYFGDALVEALTDVGLSAVVAPTLQDLAGPGSSICEEQIDSTLRIAANENLNRQGIVAALGPHATDTVSDALWTRVRDLSEKYNLPVHAHVAQSQEEHARNLETHGAPPVERLNRLGLLDTQQPFLMVHGLYVSKHELELLQSGQQSLGFCPNAQMQFDFPAHISAWRNQGIDLVLGTDAACCNDTMNIQLELRSLASGTSFAVPSSPEFQRFEASGSEPDALSVRKYRNRIFEENLPFSSPEDLLATIWSNPGRLHPELQCGRIAPGCRANLLVLNLDHPVFWPARNPLQSLALSNISPAIHALMINGSWRGTPGDFHRSIADSNEARAYKEEATARLNHALQRSGLT